MITVETSRTKLDNEDEKENPQPIRKVIKPDFNLLLDSFEVCYCDKRHNISVLKNISKKHTNVSMLNMNIQQIFTHCLMRNRC